MIERIDIREYLREYHETGEVILRGKWAMDGAESLEEAAALLRMFADELEALADAGFHLMGAVEDDHGFAHRGESASDERAVGSNGRRRSRQFSEGPDRSGYDRSRHASRIAIARRGRAQRRPSRGQSLP